MYIQQLEKRADTLHVPYIGDSLGNINTEVKQHTILK